MKWSVALLTPHWRQHRHQFLSEKVQTNWRLRPAGGPVKSSQLNLQGREDLEVPLPCSMGRLYWFGGSWNCSRSDLRLNTRAAAGIAGALWVTQSKQMDVGRYVEEMQEVEGWSRCVGGSETVCVASAGSAKLSVQTKLSYTKPQQHISLIQVRAETQKWSNIKNIRTDVVVVALQYSSSVSWGGEGGGPRLGNEVFMHEQCVCVCMFRS